MLPPREEQNNPLALYLKLKQQQALGEEKPEPATIVSAKTVHY